MRSMPACPTAPNVVAATTIMALRATSQEQEGDHHARDALLAAWSVTENGKVAPGQDDNHRLADPGQQ
jgi:hypothetical protein